MQNDIEQTCIDLAEILGLSKTIEWCNRFKRPCKRDCEYPCAMPPKVKATPDFREPHNFTILFNAVMDDAPKTVFHVNGLVEFGCGTGSSFLTGYLDYLKQLKSRNLKIRGLEKLLDLDWHYTLLN